MKYWVAVTDNKWFDFLSRENPDEVNFWQPRGQAIYAGLEPGAPFLFKLKRPYNHIGGGGFFVKSSSLPLSMVWETFGRKNGASSRMEFEAMIRPLMAGKDIDPNIGCTVLAAPFFWLKDKWIEDPKGWSGNIVRGRYYDTDSVEGAQVWSQVQGGLVAPNMIQEPGLRFGEPILIKPRLGQGGFRVVVTDAYNRRCAITGESTLPVLEAAHILPFSEDGLHEVGNGLLLRSDFHKLFDIGLITITPALRVEVSSRIKSEWFNGKAYYSLHGQRLKNIPESSEQQPRGVLLEWHNENRFRS